MIAFSKESQRVLEDGRVAVSAVVLFHQERALDAQQRAYAEKRAAFFVHMSADDPRFGALVRAHAR